MILSSISWVLDCSICESTWRCIRSSKSGAVVRINGRRNEGGFSGAGFLVAGFGLAGCAGCGVTLDVGGVDVVG